jgi:hypothetical protein
MLIFEQSAKHKADPAMHMALSEKISLQIHSGFYYVHSD